MTRSFHAGLRDSSGSVAFIFALALVPIFGLAGASIDYSRAAAARTRLQTALDAAVLAAAMNGRTPELAQAAFQGAFASHPIGSAGRATATLDMSEPTLIRGSATASVATSFLGILGVPAFNISAKSEGRTPGAVEIVMALDVSGSMRAADMSGRSRIEVMREAAGDLVDAAVAGTPGSVSLKFGYVPFTMNVNIGMANVAYVDGATDPLFAGTEWAGCVLEHEPPFHLSNAYSSLNKFRAYAYPPETSDIACINPSDGTNLGYKTVDPLVPASTSIDSNTRGPNYNCVRHPMQPLSTDAAAIKTKINAIDVSSNLGTLIAPGVTWATRLLTPNAPFPGAEKFGGGMRKVLVALTDGEQTTEGGAPSCQTSQNTSGVAYHFDPASMGLGGRPIGPNGPRDYFGPYGYLYDSDPLNIGYPSYNDVNPSLEKLALDACAYAKTLGIEVYTVAVSSSAGPGTTVHNTMRDCATDPAHFFYADDAESLKAAFTAIGRSAGQFVRTR